MLLRFTDINEFYSTSVSFVCEGIIVFFFHLTTAAISLFSFFFNLYCFSTKILQFDYGQSFINLTSFFCIVQGFRLMCVKQFAIIRQLQWLETYKQLKDWPA